MTLELIAEELGFTLKGLFETAYVNQPTGFSAGTKPLEDFEQYRRQQTVPTYLVTFLSRLEGQ